MNRPKPRATTALLQRRSRDLKRHLPAAISGNGDGVHRARVASRRLRETVPVLVKGVKGSKAGKARRKIRRLTRALGTVRELDVTVTILDELARREHLPRTALEEVRAHVLTERDRRRALMLERLETVNMENQGRRLAGVAAALQQSTSQEWRAILASRLMSRSRKLAAVVGEAGQIYEPERLHQVRIAAKKLRYALEIAADSRSAAAAPQVRLLKRIQDTLGRLHDLQVLQAHVTAVQVDPPADRRVSAAGLDAVARTIEEECRHLHGRYLAVAPALLEVCETTRRTIAPHLAARAQRSRSRSLKMAMDTTVRRRTAARRA
jgi:CHAD domain-containing protein